MISAAAAWWATKAESDHFPELPSFACSARWSILSAWCWLVDLPARDLQLPGDLHTSTVGVQREHACDCAYRGAMPKGLGRAIDRSPGRDASLALDSPALSEDLATWRDGHALDAEAARGCRAALLHAKSIRVTSCLLFGLRRLHVFYRK